MVTDFPARNIALFIDADNAPAKSIEFILTDLANYGSLAIRRAYGNWKSDNLKQWEGCLCENAIQPIQQFDMTKGKNATDMAMTIDAMDILYQKNMAVFGFVSSDCDFAPLATRVRAEGKIVVGYGERKTPEAFTNACTTFSYVDDLGDDDEPRRKTNPVDGNTLKGDTKLLNLLRNSIEACADEEGWALLSRMGHSIRNQSSFDPRNYGYKGLGDLLSAIDLFEIQKNAGGGANRVRDLKKHP
ncbi:MAG: NYN domain-containing protein [Pseudodesulfovibrio sp.]|uniref:NYN domain-containing protein n=1 Tax=Pseudodesulfovibrio sp. TaxID=2035812 RepID=UPI003D12487D